MKLTATFVLFALVFSSSAIPVAQKTTAGSSVKVALTKRTTFTTSAGLDGDALQHHFHSATSKFHRGFASYHNNTGKPHPLASEGLAKRGTAANPLLNAHNMLWHGAITIGTPPQNFTVDFDTGSSDLILPDPACTTSCEGHRAYQPSKSSSSEGLFSSFKSSFGDSSAASGKRYKDTVTIAGMTAKSQTFGTALSYSGGFASSRFPADGLLGMAFKPISELNANPVFQTLMSHNQTDSNVFAFKLGANESELTLGGVNTDLYQGEFAWADVTEPAYWQVQLDAIDVGNETVSKAHAAIIDTGTTLLIADTQTVKSVYAAIPGSKLATSLGGPGFYTFPCASNATVSLTFSGRAFEIPSTTFSLGPAFNGSEECVGGLVGNDDMKFWIVGDVFLRGVYTAFDVENKRVGFADLA